MPTKPPASKLNCFLRTRKEIDDCTDVLRQHGLVEHGLSCKNWDLVKILPHINDGNFLDLGCNGSFILDNLAKLNLSGLKYGVDLSINPTDVVPSGCAFFKQDLMNTTFDSGTFQYLTCLSVIEHQVDFNLLAKECARLLSSSGKLFLTFDYWDPKVDTSATKLYDLNWNVLDKNDVLSLMAACSQNGLELSEPIDWTTQDGVINPSYCSPAKVSYTFGILMFTKKG